MLLFCFLASVSAEVLPGDVQTFIVDLHNTNRERLAKGWEKNRDGNFMPPAVGMEKLVSFFFIVFHSTS